MRVPRPTLVQGLVRTVGVNRKSARLARRRVTLATLDIVSYPYSTRSIERTDSRRTPATLAVRATRHARDVLNSHSHPMALESASTPGAHASGPNAAGSGGLHVGANESSPFVDACAAIIARHIANLATNIRKNGSDSMRAHAGSNPRLCLPVPREGEADAAASHSAVVARSASANLAAASGDTCAVTAGPHSAQMPASGDVRKSVKKEPAWVAPGALGGAQGGAQSTTGTRPPGTCPPGSESARNCRDTSASTMRKSDRRVNGTMSEG